MASITGLLIFNVNRSGLIDFANDSGVANIPIVLTATLGQLLLLLMIAVNINFLMYLLEIIESL